MRRMRGLFAQRHEGELWREASCARSTIEWSLTSSEKDGNFLETSLLLAYGTRTLRLTLHFERPHES